MSSTHRKPLHANHYPIGDSTPWHTTSPSRSAAAKTPEPENPSATDARNSVDPTVPGTPSMGSGHTSSNCPRPPTGNDASYDPAPASPTARPPRTRSTTSANYSPSPARTRTS